MVTQEIVYWENFEWPIKTGLLSDNGKTLITSSRNGRIQFWPMPKSVNRMAIQPKNHLSLSWGLIKYHEVLIFVDLCWWYTCSSLPLSGQNVIVQIYTTDIDELLQIAEIHVTRNSWLGSER